MVSLRLNYECFHKKKIKYKQWKRRKQNNEEKSVHSRTQQSLIRPAARHPDPDVPPICNPQTTPPRRAP